MADFIWTDTVTSRFIDLIEENEIIWNIRSKEYKNRDLRKRTVLEVCDALNITEDQFKRKWNTLRTQFNAEAGKVEKYRKSGSGADDVYTPKWMWFSRLMFLSDVIGPKKSISNLCTFEQKDDDTTQSQEASDEDENASVGDAESIESEQSTAEKAPTTNEMSSVSAKKKMKFSRTVRTPTRDLEMKMLQTATGFLESMKNSRSNPKPQIQTEEDEYDIFGKHIANELRQIRNPQILRLVKHKINNIIFEAQGDVQFTQPQNSYDTGISGSYQNPASQGSLNSSPIDGNVQDSSSYYRLLTM